MWECTMKDEQITRIRDKVFQTFAVAENDFESGAILLDSEKYRTCIPLFRESLLGGIKALILLQSDELPPESNLIEAYNKHQVDKHIKLDIGPQEILEKLKTAEEDSIKNPLNISKKSIQDLDICSKHIEKFLGKAHRWLKKMLLTVKEKKRKETIRKVVLISVAAVVAIFVVVQAGMFFSSLSRGLTAEYFVGQNFENPLKTKREKSIDFNWELGSLVADHVDNVSIRLTGRVKAPRHGRYTFITHSDDGTRLWIDDKLIIDDWNVHPEETRTAEIDLEEGYHAIKLEYFEGNGFASLKLLWTPPGETDQKVIKPAFLRKN